MTALDLQPGTRTRNSTVGPGPRSARRGGLGLSRAAVNTVLIVYVLYNIFPLISVISMMNKDTAGLKNTSVFAFDGFHMWQNVKAVFTADNGIFVHWYLNTAVYAVVGAGAQAFLCCLAGYAFDKFEFRFKKPLFAFILLGSLVPMAVLLLPEYLLFSKLHLINTMWAILIPSVVNPGGVFIARVFSESYVPNELVEAARIDGAGEWRTFRSVGLRLLGPGYTYLFITGFTGVWQGYQLALMMLTKNNLYPLNLGIADWNTQANSEMPTLAPVALTASVLAFIPLIIVMITCQRFWKAGLTGGALK